MASRAAHTYSNDLAARILLEGTGKRGIERWLVADHSDGRAAFQARYVSARRAGAGLVNGRNGSRDLFVAATEEKVENHWHGSSGLPCEGRVGSGAGRSTGMEEDPVGSATIPGLQLNFITNRDESEAANAGARW